LILTNARAKTVLKSLQKQDRQNDYCPEYASGPFAILCTLYDQMVLHQRLSLEESRLKELAQPRCRSDLYDHQAKWRNAFACMDALKLIRMERLPGQREERKIYSLLPKGEALA